MILIPKRKDFIFIQKKKLFEGAKRAANYNTRRWKNLRVWKLKRNPICEICKLKGLVKPATVVDHIKPVREGGKMYHEDNLQSLCKRHHDSKTAKEIAQRKHMNSVDDDMGVKK